MGRQALRALLPQTRAYHEIWLNGEKLVGRRRRGAHPRAALSTAEVQDRSWCRRTTTWTFLAGPGFHRHPRTRVGEGKLLGFNLTVGGGLGATHGEPQTFPRLADVIGFLTPDQILKVAETVVMIQRDFGDRTDRKHARLKYTIADRGVDWFKAELFKRLGFALEPPRALHVHHAGRPLRLAARARWPLAPHVAHRVGPRRRHARRPFLTGLEKIAAIHQGDFRLTANQNLIIANVPASECMNIDRLVADHGLGKALFTTPLRRDALACVSLPTCALAMAEAERYLPSFIDRVEALLFKHGLGKFRSRCASPAARTAARGPISPRSRSSAGLPAATRCDSVPTPSARG